MACRFAAQLQRNLARDNKLQSLHRSGIITCNDVFKQVPQTDVKHYHMCSNSVHVPSWAESLCMASI